MQSFIKIRGAVLEKNGIKIMILCNFNKDSNYLINAAYFGHFEAVKYFYRKEGYCTLRNGRTPIHMASEKGHLNIVKFLVQNGHDPSAQCEKGMTPIYLASKYGNLDVVKYLISNFYDNFYDIFMTDHENWFSSIHVSVINGHLDVLKVLVTLAKYPNHSGLEGY